MNVSLFSNRLDLCGPIGTEKKIKKMMYRSCRVLWDSIRVEQRNKKKRKEKGKRNKNLKKMMYRSCRVLWDSIRVEQRNKKKNKRKREKKQELKEDGVLKLLQSSFQSLQDTLPAMYNFINQVESRSHEKGVAEFLPELKAAVYDAEGLLKYFRWYEQKVKIEGSATSAEPITKFFQVCIQDDFYTQFTAIKNRLYNQYMMMVERMGLHQATLRFDEPLAPPVSSKKTLRFDRSVRLRPKTTSFPTEATIFGRDAEITELIRMLVVPGPSRLKRKRSAICSSASNQVCGALDSNEATITSVPVLPIVGFGGVGKTTLAQFICHHEQVKRHFDVIVWICISDDFDVKRSTKEVIEQFSGKTPTEDTLSSLQVGLANSINQRRFIVVLDGMWAENGELWKTFYAPFKDVLEGSMMLVTTRSPKVADLVHTVDPFVLEGLEDHIFYAFFKQCAFGSYSSNKNPALERIGKQILPKLKGSPLAAKICGRMLGMSLDPAHWNSILKGQLREPALKSQLREPWLQEETDILPALQLKKKKDLQRMPQTDVPPMLEPQHFASTSAGTQAATSFHIDVPPIWPPPMSMRQRGRIDSDSSILKVLKIALRMNKDMSNALHREKQARKRDSKRIKRVLRQIKKLKKEGGKEVSPSGSEVEELEVESEGEQYPDVDALISRARSELQYGQSYAQGGGYGYGFGGQFHPGPSSSSALQQHQQFGPRDYLNAANPSVCHFYGGTSPAGSGYGYGGRLSVTDSEASYGSEPDSPPPEGKGKAVPVDGGRRRRRTRNPGGFMAAARRSHPQVDGTH